MPLRLLQRLAACSTRAQGQPRIDRTRSEGDPEVDASRPVSASFLPRYSGVWKSQSTQGGCPAGQNRCEKIAMCWVAMFPRLSVALSTRRAASLALEQPEQPGLSSPTRGTEL